MFGPATEGETSYAGRLLRLLRPEMLVLWDKGFDSNAFLAAVTDTGAQVLGRLRGNRRTPVLTRLVDGSYLSVIGAVKVWIVDARIAVTCADGTSFTGSYRLVTTLTDARRHPATALVGLYQDAEPGEGTSPCTTGLCSRIWRCGRAAAHSGSGGWGISSRHSWPTHPCSLSSRWSRNVRTFL